jgi:hypothetical protein
MKKLSSVAISGGLIVDQATTLSGVVNIGGIGTGAYTSVLVRNSSNQMFHRTYSDFLNDISGSLNISGYLPLTGGTLTGGLIGTTGSFSSNGGSNTFTINHTSGGGLGLSITKGGNNEALYINKTGGSGNAVTIVGTLNATTIVKNGGTSSQYLMADGSVSTLSNPVTGTGTTNFIPKFTGGSAIGNSQIFDNGTNVGIGTASPGYKLDVSGTGRFAGNVIINSDNTGVIVDVASRHGFMKYFLYSAGLVGANTGTDNNISTWLGRFSGSITSPTQVFQDLVVMNSGNVGIGTTSPSTILHLSSTAPELSFTATGLNRTSTVGMGDGANFYIKNTSAGNMYISDYNSVYIAYGASSQNVGIGTTSPAYKLDIAGSARVSLLNSYYTYTEDYGIGTPDSAGLQIFAGGGDVVRFGHRTTGTFTERMRITSTGNVGIGTTSPEFKLDVNGNIKLGTTILFSGTNYYPRIARSSNDLQFSTDNAGSADVRMAITSAGNVGIGTTAPVGKLHIAATSGVASPGSTALAIRDAGSPTFGFDFNLEGVSTGDLSLTRIVSGVRSQVMTFDRANGNIGIGTSSPAQKLHVVGNVSVTSGDYRIYNGSTILSSTSTSLLEINAGGFSNVSITNGNVGIGTTSPGYKLEVAGTSYFSGLAHFGQTASNGSAFRWGAFGTAVSSDTMLCHNQLWNGSGWTILNSSVGTSYMNLGGQVASPDIQFGTGGANTPATTKMTILNSGNVGIGTASPAFKLEVNAGANAGAFLQGSSDVRYHVFSSSSFDWVGYELRSSNVNSFAGGMFRNNASNDRISIYNKNAEAISILDTGNVGIGTTSPGRQLELAGAADAYIQLTRNNTGVQATLGFNTGVTNDWLIRTDDVDSNLKFYSYGTSGYALILARSTGAATFSSTIASGGNINVGGQLTFTPNEARIISGSSTFAINNNANNLNLLLINNSTGNVGIGTSTPGYKLDVQGSAGNITINTNGLLSAGGQIISGTGEFASSSSGTDLNFRAGATHLMVLKTSGNVGIGTTSPSTNLDVVGGLNVSDGTSTLRFVNSAGVGLIGTLSNHSLGIRTNNTERMRITSAGNVGIGTTSPGDKLHVVTGGVGGIAIFQGGSGRYIMTGTDSGGQYIEQVGTSAGERVFRIQNSNGSGTYTQLFLDGANQRIYTGSNVNVGIGTAAPGAKLDIVSTGSGSEGLRVDGASGGFAFVVKGGSDYTSHMRAGATIGVNYFTTPPSNGLIVEGNVGIGTTSPGAKLEVSDFGGATIKISNKTDGVQTTGDLVGALDYYSYDADYPRTMAYVRSYVTEQFGRAADLRFATTTTNAVVAEAMRITSSGNVGIGTTNPGAKLHVAVGYGLLNNAYSWAVYNTSSNGFAAQFGAANDVAFANTGNNAIISVTGSNSILFGTNSTEKMRITSAGNVGIGTTSPKVNLDVAGAGGKIGITNTGTTNYSELMFYEGSTVKAEVFVNGSSQTGYAGANSMNIWQGSNAAMAFYTNATERMRITSGGNVLIGTTTDVGSKLYVDGTIRTSGALVSGGLLEFTGGWSASPYNPSSWIRAASGVGLFLVNNSISKWAGFNSTSDFIVNSGDIYVSSSSGNVGIGTTSPNEKLTILGSAATTFQGGGIYNSHAYGNADKAESRFNLGKLEGATYQPMGAIGAFPSDNTSSDSGVLSFYTRISQSLTEKMRITNGGNVGIGTTSPGAKLDVNGEVYVSPNTAGKNTFVLTTNASNDGRLLIKSDTTTKVDIQANGVSYFNGGNIGIGTTAPDQALHVNGNVKIDGLVTNGPVVASGGVLTAVLGYTGVVPIIGNPPGQQNLEFVNGILVNVF